MTVYHCPQHGMYYPRCPQCPEQSYKPPPRGCICPPTAEQTCQSPTCPRKNPLGVVPAEVR